MSPMSRDISMNPLPLGGVVEPMSAEELKEVTGETIQLKKDRCNDWPPATLAQSTVLRLLATIADREESREAQLDAFHACINLYAPKDDFPDDPPAARLGKIIAARDAEIERLRAEVERTAQDGHISANDAIRAEARAEKAERERDEARADRDAQRHSILNKGGRRCLCTAPKSNPHDEGSDGWHEHGWRFPDRRY